MRHQTVVQRNGRLPIFEVEVNRFLPFCLNANVRWVPGFYKQSDGTFIGQPKVSRLGFSQCKTIGFHFDGGKCSKGVDGCDVGIGEGDAINAFNG